MIGFQLTLGKLESGNWVDDDERDRTFRSWGIKLVLAAGKIYRPFPKFWRYKIGGNWKNAPNPWTDPDDCWFVLRGWGFGPFLSIAIRRFGFYVGFKPHSLYGLVPSIRITFNRRF